MSPMGYAGVTYILNTITRSPSSRRPSKTSGSPSPRSIIRTGAGTLSFRNDKVRRSSSPTNPQNPKSVRGNLLLHNKKFPLGEMGVLLVTCGSYCWMRPRRLCYSEITRSVFTDRHLQRLQFIIAQ